MKIELEWLQAWDLRDGSKLGLIYDIPYAEEIPPTCGVYVFSRIHSGRTIPLYVGRALDLRQRIIQQLNNVKLMQGLKRAPKGGRTLHVAFIMSNLGVRGRTEHILRITESLLISSALVEGFDLINILGKNTVVHSLRNRGNREAREWMPLGDMKVRRAAE